MAQKSGIVVISRYHSTEANAFACSANEHIFARYNSFTGGWRSERERVSQEMKRNEERKLKPILAHDGWLRLSMQDALRGYRTIS